MFRLTAVAADDNTCAKRYTVGGIKQIDQDMAACALLRNAYVAANRPRWHEAFLSLLPFDDEYRSDLRSALVDNQSVRRLVATNHQAAMLHAANQVLIGDGRDVQLTPAHLQALLDTMPTGRDDAACQSYFLSCIAAVLARLSSTAFFGTHDDGPFAVRRYAAALINAAIRIEDGKPTAPRIGYVEHLPSDNCTEVLSYEMLRDLAAETDESLRHLFDTVRPRNWGPLQ